jgi:glycosyltransferase involved in cell wall biosynthesis
MSGPPHIVHVTTSDGFAGVERYILGSALSLRAAGCRVTVVGGAPASMRPSLEAAGVAWLPGDDLRGAARSLGRIRDVDLIDSHMSEADLVAVLAGLCRRIPVVSTRHFGSPRGSGPVARLVGRWIGRRLAAQIAISRFVAATIDGASHVIHTGVDDQPDVPDGAREPTVLLLQRLEPEKAAAEALEAWARVADRGGWRLAIAGDGSQRAELTALAARLGIAESVDFLGFRADVHGLLARASIFVAPTPREGLGISVIEAMAAGTPVVAAAGGGHLETAGAVDGAALYAVGDPDAAARELARLMADPAARARYGAALRDRQRSEFSRARQTEGTLRVFTAVLAEAARR